MEYLFKSVLAKEFSEYIALLLESGRYINKIQSSIRSLDKYLFLHGITEKSLTEDVIVSWLDGKDVKPRTKSGILSNIKGLAKYLITFGFTISLPDDMIVPDDYVPYIFNEEEFSHIIFAADNFMVNSRLVPSSYQFPILLRILYGCGLRLREALTLEWNNIDLKSGVMDIIEAKNNVQRRIPLSCSLQTLMIQYKDMIVSYGESGRYVFESKYNLGKPYCNNTFEVWFSKILKSADIKYKRKAVHERGPCPHCLRHLFTIHSFLKLETEGKTFEEAVPFISAYLGHHSLMETEKYLRADYSMYTKSHQRISEHISDVFPEVNFE